MEFDLKSGPTDECVCPTQWSTLYQIIFENPTQIENYSRTSPNGSNIKDAAVNSVHRSSYHNQIFD